MRDIVNIILSPDIGDGDDYDDYANDDDVDDDDVNGTHRVEHANAHACARVCAKRSDGIMCGAVPQKCLGTSDDNVYNV